MKHEAPNQFLPAAQPQQGLRLQSESALAHGGHFCSQSSPRRQVRNPQEVLMKLKRELYDVKGSGLGKNGFGLAWDERR